MPVVALDIAICNSALLLLGADEINTFEDETDEAKVCAAIYPRTVAALMELYPWRFSMKQANLNKITGFTPLIGFANAFQLPTDRLRAVFKPYTTLEYRILGDKVYTNADEFKMEYQYRAPEAVWSESFSRAVEFDMARALAVALLEDDSRADRYEKLVRQQLQRAKSVDGQQQQGDEPDDSQFSLISARW